MKILGLGLPELIVMSLPIILILLFIAVIALIVVIIVKAATRKGPAQGGSGADELMKFKELLDNNAITQEEFEAKKAEILQQH